MLLPELISDLAVILLTGGIVTVIFKKLNQPLVLGYILAGFLIGPYMPFFFNVTDSASISTWSEIGIIILMFGLGLEFNLHKLVSVGGTAIITALVEVGGMLAFGFAVGQLMGWGTMDSVFLGGMLSMSSTTIIIKAFDELNVRKKDFAQLVFGTLVMEDIAGIFMMIILSTISVSKSISGGALALQLGLLVLYLVLMVLLASLSAATLIVTVPLLLACLVPLMIFYPAYMLDERSAGIWNTFLWSMRNGFKCWGGSFLILFVCNLLMSVLSGLLSVPMYVVLIVRALLVGASGQVADGGMLFDVLQYFTSVLMLYASYLSTVVVLLGATYQYGHIREKMDAVTVDEDIENFDKL